MSSTQLVSGLGAAIGSDFVYSKNQLVFVEYATGKVSKLDLFPSFNIVSQGTATLKGTYSFDFDGAQISNQAADVWWEQQTSILRQLVPQNNARIMNMGIVNFNTITAANLQNLPYSTTPIAGNNNATNKLVNGDVFAVKTNKGNYAKVKVVTYGYDLVIEWVTYNVNSGYSVLGAGYTTPEDIKLSADGIHAYVTERTGNLLKIALSNANRSAAILVASGMTAPQEIALDEAHNAAYVVEYKPSGTLVKIDLTNGTKTTIISGLNNAVGLVLSSDLQYAYISEQTTGPDLGRVSAYLLSNGSKETIVKGLTAPFFLRWLDSTQSLLLVPERDPANRIDLINIAAKTSQVVLNGVPFRPSSVALPNTNQMLVCCDQEIDIYSLSPLPQPGGPLLMGIGFIPFDEIAQTGSQKGRADTTVNQSYFYQVKNTPFGGTLPLMINHQRAANDGASYYRVQVDNQIRMDSWTDQKWNGTQYIATPTNPMTVNGKVGCYPVHPISELFLWMNPSLGSLMDSTSLSKINPNHHTIVIEFLNANGNPLEYSTPLTILVDNEACIAALSPVTLNNKTADACGLLVYNNATKTTDQVLMRFIASQPDNNATFSISLYRGVTPVTTLPPPTSGPVSSAISPVQDTVGDLLKNCNIAAFALYLYVAATANNGWNRQSQYDASAAQAFVLSPQ
ncbi:MAG TPA: hypothetical protein VK253_08695 [Candidatus Binatia bacterium]|nr:hypothetical protein [Candidatus Binatia bacterium]